MLFYENLPKYIEGAVHKNMSATKEGRRGLANADSGWQRGLGGSNDC